MSRNPWLVFVGCSVWLAACTGPGGGGGGGVFFPDTGPVNGCSNGQLDPGEVDVDCGGACAPCAAGKACVGGDDCESGVCSVYVCRDAGCGNGAQDGDETGVDCGGACPACVGQGCSGNADCASGYCKGDVCDVPTCADGVRNGAETGVDCGGPECDQCDDGGGCLVDANCKSGFCAGGFCATPSCSDEARNGAETDVDCGGACPGCADGKACLGDGDCVSGKCLGGACVAVAPACDDGQKNGAETDVDCGGGCKGCGFGKGCVAPSDCASGLCDGGSCGAPASCEDNEKSGDETDVDCGGDCKGCALGQLCDGHADCLSATCIFGVCAAPTCDDEVKNQKETDVDCGGNKCEPCGDGRACGVEADCASGRCTGGVCTSCQDGAKNGGEADVDCGGECQACADGKTCGAASDCASGRCTGGVCTSCEDGAKNGGEADVDCGGECQACADGKTCGVGDDCDSGYCCAGQCVPGTQVDHCGGCAACPGDANGAAVCVEGSCGLTCKAGFHLCGGKCVSNAATATCGSSCSPCPGDPNGVATCDGSKCGIACSSGYHLCGGKCVSDTATATCGSSCSPCPGDPNGVATCDGTKCGVTCDPGYHLCGGKCVSDDSVDHCGASCSPCAAPGPNASVACMGGGCVYTCDAGTVACGTECRTPAQLTSALVETQYGTPGYSEYGERLYPTADGGFFVVGYTSPSDEAWSLQPKGWMLRVDAAGGVVWEHELDLPEGRTEHEVRAARELPGGGWLIVGAVRGGLKSYRGWVAEVGPDGAVKWDAEVDQTSELHDILPISDTDSLVVGVQIGAPMYGRLGANAALTWHKTLTQASSPSAARLSDGSFVVAARDSSTNLTKLRRVTAAGVVTDLPDAAIATRALAGLDLGGFVMAGDDQHATWQFKPLLVRASAAGAVLDTDQPTFTGTWTAVAARPGGALVLGGRRDYASGWNPLVMALADDQGQLVWTQNRFNTSGLQLYVTLMKDAVMRPTGGYAWLATTDESYESTYKTARLLRITCDGPGVPPVASDIVISELLYDAVDTDDDVFVELRGPAGASLSGYTLVGVNGNGGDVYKTVALTGSIPADGVYLVANTTAAAWIAQHADQIASVDFQNGPDSVQLRSPSGQVLDALGYGNFSGWVFAGEGTPAPATGPGKSLTRDTDATDTGDNFTDFTVSATPTPGAP